MADAVRPRSADRLLLRGSRGASGLAAAVDGSRVGPRRWPGLVGRPGTVHGEPPTADTQYRIGSITKTLIAVCVMRLRDKGRLGLADHISAHLPETKAADATIAQLLSHSQPSVAASCSTPK